MRGVKFVLLFLIGLVFCLEEGLVSGQATATAETVEEATTEDITDTQTNEAANLLTEETTTETGAEAESESEADTTTTVDDKTVPDELESVKEDVVEGVQESTTTTSSTTEKDEGTPAKADDEPVQAGPLVDLVGPTLYSLALLDSKTAQISSNYTNEALAGKSVIGLYFSADWCGPCRKFTPELVSFYEKMNNRRGKKNQFEIVWVSRCRDANSYTQYFAHMPWLALPPEDAAGEIGQKLSDKYKVKGIPTLVLVDDVGQTITTDARNKIPQDKAGIGFPWRNPFAQLYITIIPKSLRLMVKSQIDGVKSGAVRKLKSIIGLGTQTTPTKEATAAA